MGAHVSALAPTESDELSTGQRVIRNQVLTRSAPVVGRGLTAIGTAAVAYGAARSRIPRTKRPFTVVPKKEAKRLGRYKKGRYIHYRPETVWNRLPQIDVQERRSRRAHRKPRTDARVLKGAGTIMIATGKALPVLAYGYVAYDIARRVRADDKVTAEEVVDEIWQVSLSPQAMAISQYQPSMASSNLLSKMVSRLA